jgi:hypothetical protein
MGLCSDFSVPWTVTAHLAVVRVWVFFRAIYMNTCKHMIPVYFQFYSLAKMSMDWEQSSLVEQLSCMEKILGLVPNTTKTEKH